VRPDERLRRDRESVRPGLLDLPQIVQLAVRSRSSSMVRRNVSTASPTSVEPFPGERPASRRTGRSWRGPPSEGGAASGTARPGPAGGRLPRGPRRGGRSPSGAPPPRPYRRRRSRGELVSRAAARSRRSRDPSREVRRAVEPDPPGRSRSPDDRAGSGTRGGRPAFERKVPSWRRGPPAAPRAGEGGRGPRGPRRLPPPGTEISGRSRRRFATGPRIA